MVTKFFAIETHIRGIEKEEKMRKNYWIALALVMILPAMLFTVSCAKKAVESEPVDTTTQQEQPAMTQETQPSTDQGSQIDQETLQAQQAEQARQAARNMFMNEDIYFEFDSSTLLPAAQQVLSMKADYMRNNPGIYVTVEGHCDERGTNAYNMALGQRRADAAKEFLVNLGIDGGRLAVISYGEERPVDYGHNEEAWAKNRRGHFVIE